jgi:hypothetical protein
VSVIGAARARLREEPMRAILAAAMLLISLSRTTPEPEYSALLPGSFHLGGGDAVASLVEIESSQAKGDRETIAVAPPVTAVGGQTPTASQKPAAPATNSDSTPPTPQTPAAPNTNPASTSDQLPNSNAANAAPPQVSVDDLCNALLTSAQDNDLPIAFFANLIWQESRLRDDAVSPKGALGIAQFMPKVATASGLENPFDPLAALAASARLLHELRDQFGNLGFVAAAYNAGAKRVSEWLERGRTLPRETRGYVIGVTGRSVEQWQKAPQDAAELHFVRPLPCREMPAFTELEHAQLQEAQLEQQQARQAQQAQRAKAEQQAKAEQPQKLKAAKKAVATTRERHERSTERKDARRPLRHETVRTVARERERAKQEAKERIRHAPRERHRRA